MNTWVILPLFFVLSAHVRAETLAADVVGARPGYVFDVEAERNRHDEALVLIPPPPPERPLTQKLFDEKLTKDIREQYAYRFGQTAMEQTINAPTNRESEYYYSGDTTVTAQKYQEYQRSFGEYMYRRAIETQVDNYFKSQPGLKKVYEFKDRISNVNVQTQSGYKFKWAYNISGNSSTLEVENPYHIETKLRVQFKQLSTETEEETLSMSYKINELYTVSTYYKFYDGVYQLVGSRRITSSVSATLTGSTTTTESGPSVRQNIALIGISWTQ
jgi:hypothetical protein